MLSASASAPLVIRTTLLRHASPRAGVESTTQNPLQREPQGAGDAEREVESRMSCEVLERKR